MKGFIFSLLALFVLLAYSPPCLAFESNHERQKIEFCAQIEIIYTATIFVEDFAEIDTVDCFAENANNQTETKDLSRYFASSDKNKDNLSCFYWCNLTSNIGLVYLNPQIYIKQYTKISHNKQSSRHYRKNYISYNW